MTQIQQIKSFFEGQPIKVTNSDGSRFIVECEDTIKETKWGLLFYVKSDMDYYEIQECNVECTEYYGATEEFYSFEDLIDYLNETY